MLRQGRRRLSRRVLQGARERGRVSGRGRARSGANGTVSAGRAAELAGLWRFEHGAGGNGMERWAALVVGGLSRREGSLVDGHVAEKGRLPAGEKGFMGIFKTPDQLEVANDILLHVVDCTRISISISSDHGSLHLPTVAAYGGLLVRVTVHDEVGQVNAPLHLVSRVSDGVGSALLGDIGPGCRLMPGIWRLTRCCSPPSATTGCAAHTGSARD